MTAEVVPLRALLGGGEAGGAEKAPEVVWECNCGCQHFWLHEDGRIECPDCKAWQDEMQGYWKLCEPPGAAA